MNETALVKKEFVDVAEALKLGEVLYRSGYFGDIRNAQQAVVKILRGYELGIGPIQALEQIYVVNGKTALSAGLVGALIKRSGRYDYRVVVSTDEKAEIAFYESGKEIGRSTFTIDEAERAGLLGKDGWKKYPADLLFARALTRGARRFCPDVFGGGVYTPEELQGGEVIEDVVTIDASLQPQEEDRATEVPAFEENSTEQPPEEPEQPQPKSNGKDMWSWFWSEVRKLGFSPKAVHEAEGVDTFSGYTREQLEMVLEKLRKKASEKGKLL